MKKHLLATIVCALFTCGLTTDVWGFFFDFTNSPESDAKKIETAVRDGKLAPAAIKKAFEVKYKKDLEEYIPDWKEIEKNAPFNFSKDPVEAARQISKLIRKKKLEKEAIKEQFDYFYSDDLDYYI